MPTRTWIPRRDILRWGIGQEEEEIERLKPPEDEDEAEQVRQAWESIKREMGWLPPSEIADMPRQVMGKPFASLVTRPWWEKEATPRELATPPWIPQVAPFERWKAPWGVKGGLELAGELPLWAALPIPEAPIGRGFQWLGKAFKGKPRGAPLTEAISKAPEVVPTEVTPFADKLKGALDYALSTQKETKALQKAGLREKALKLEEVFTEPEGVKTYYKALGALKGKLERGEFKMPKEFQFTEQEIGELLNSVATKTMDKFDKVHAQTALMKLAGLVKNPETGATEQLIKSEIKLLSEVFPELSPLVQAYRTLGSKAWSTFVDAANIPRALLASGDFSVTFRQGGMLLTRAPQDLPGTLLTQMKTVFSPKNYRLLDETLRANPKITRFLDEGLWFGPEPGKAVGRLWMREETFMSNLAERIPGLGKFIRASERAFIGGGNYLRGKAAERYYNLLEKAGALTDEEIHAGALLINAASGRGSLPAALKGVAPLLNAVMFAPRYVVSRFEVPAMILNPATPPIARRQAIRTLVQFLGFGTSVLTMASLAGAEVETDDRSSDFGKIKIGNTRLDIWAGYVQWARFIGQLVTNERKIIGTGEVQELNRLETVWRMLQSKGSPIFSIFVDLLAGQTFVGEPMFEDPAKRIRERLTPLFAQDLWDAIEADGLMGGLAASLGFVGAGVVSYPPREEPPPIRKPFKFGGGKKTFKFK